MQLTESINVPRFVLGFIICLSTARYQVLGASKDDDVDWPGGSIDGNVKRVPNGKKYYLYEGIPYAEPPIGDRRFEPTELYKRWPGKGLTLIAHEPGSSCMQYNRAKNTVEGSEDCLYLNIYIPSDGHGPEHMPVLFFIHGPDFQSGSGDALGPKFIMDWNTVLVTFNYRLGALGFLSTEDDVVPGNMGLKDQMLALKWVRRYIHNFRGDPNNITIIGHGAGGASAHYHYMSPKTKGYFHRGISMSGTALSPWALAKGSLEKAKLLAKTLFCPTENTRIMIKCMKNITADYIVWGSLQFRTYLTTPWAPFGPVIETPNSTALITESPMDTILSGRAHDLPWITGVVGAEGLCVMAGIVADNSAIETMGDDWEKIAPEMLDFNYTLPLWRQVRAANWIRKEYVGEWSFVPSTVIPAILMFSDRMFNNGAVLAARLHAKMGNSRVRLYRFGYRGLHSFSEVASGSSRNFGVAHADDLAYLMDSPINLDSTDSDRRMREMLIRFWVTYSRSGTGAPDMGFEWPPISKTDEPMYFNILGPDEMKAYPLKDTIGRTDFWESLGIQEDPLLKNPYKPKRTAERTFWYENQVHPCNGTEITLTD